MRDRRGFALQCFAEEKLNGKSEQPKQALLGIVGLVCQRLRCLETPLGPALQPATPYQKLPAKTNLGKQNKSSFGQTSPHLTSSDYHCNQSGVTTTMAEIFELSIPLPRSLDTRIYVHVTLQSKSIMIFLTTASADDGGSAPPMGSFVYALPDVSSPPPSCQNAVMAELHHQKFNPREPLSTSLYTVEPTVEFATRVAKLFARRTQRPVYVGSSMSFQSAGLGGTVEEEIEAFKSVVEAVNGKLQPALHITNGLSNLSISS